MICQRCLLRLSQPHPNATRLFSSFSSRRDPSTVSSPAATTQPFSTPFTTPATFTSPSDSDNPQIISSTPAGTSLKGLGYLKGKDPPVAREEAEYPKWLWGLLDKKTGVEDGEAGKESEGDEWSKSKKQRKAAARLARRSFIDPATIAPKIPLDEQSVDLPGRDRSLEGAREASSAREELTEVMRKRRRKGIKTANFLKGMR